MTFPIHVIERPEADRIFAPFPGVGLAPQTVHGDRQGFVGLWRQRPQGHAAGAEPLDDIFGRFHLVDVDRVSIALEIQQIPQGRHRTSAQIVLVGLVVVVSAFAYRFVEYLG